MYHLFVFRQDTGMSIELPLQGHFMGPFINDSMHKRNNYSDSYLPNQKRKQYVNAGRMTDVILLLVNSIGSSN